MSGIVSLYKCELVQRDFLLRFLRVGIDVSSGIALNAAATFYTAESGQQVPLGHVLTGCATALLLIKDRLPNGSDAAEEALAKVVGTYGTLREALIAIAEGRAGNGIFSREAASALLRLGDAEVGDEHSSDETSLLLHIGEWIERWCLDHNVQLAQFQQQFDALAEQLKSSVEENRQLHRETQRLVRRVRYFVDVDSYFRPHLDPTCLFRHDWPIVGRAEVVSGVSQFIREGPAKIGLLSGRGGIGKSKVLLAAVKHAREAGWEGTIYFVPENVPLAELTEAELPPAGSVVVVDDAHRYVDLPELLTVLNLNCPNIRVLLATRPHAVNYIRDVVIGAKYDVTQLCEFAPLPNLTRPEIKQLATVALGPKFEHLVDDLIDATWDSPLVTVMAGQLVAREAIAPSMLERKDAFREAVLSRFRDEIVGKVDDRVPASDCASVMDVLSAVAPADTRNEFFISRVANFTNLTVERVTKAFAALEAAGVLVRRAGSVRITPDVLADHILQQACISRGAPTAFADRAFESFFDFFPAQVLKNLAELDWRNEHGGDGAASSQLLSRIWRRIEDDFKTSPFGRQASLMKLFASIAFLRPDDVLRVIEQTLRDAGPDVLNDGLTELTFGSPHEVIREMPRVLGVIAHRVEYVGTCVDILWRIGRGDRRALNPNPKHAIRVVQDIAEYAELKPLKVQEQLLDRISVWLDQPDSKQHAHVIVSILRPLLAKSGHSTTARRAVFEMRPFLVDAETTKSVRQRALEMLFGFAAGGDMKAAAEAINVLAGFLSPPCPPFGMPVPDGCRETWEPEQNDVLDRLFEIFASSSDGLRRYLIVRSLPRHSFKHHNGHVRAVAEKCASRLAADVEVQRLRILQPFGWSEFDVPEDDEEEPNDWEKRQKRKLDALDVVVRRLIETHSCPGELLKVLTADALGLRSAGLNPDAWQLFHSIGRVDVDYARRLAERIWTDDESLYLFRTDALLAHWFASDRTAARLALRRLADDSRVSIRRLAAQSLSTIGWFGEPVDADLETLRLLLSDSDEVVRAAAVGSLAGLRTTQPREAIELAHSTEIGTSPQVATQVCEALCKDYGSLHEAVTDADLARCLDRLIPVSSFEEHRLSHFVKLASARVPSAVVDLLLKRIQASRDDRRHTPMPHCADIFDAAAASQVAGYEEMIRRVRDAMVAADDTGDSTFWLSRLYGYTTAEFSLPAALPILTERIDIAEAKELQAISDIFREAGRYVVFTHAAIAARLLDRAFSLGDDCFQCVRYHLRSSAQNGLKHGTAGKPFPEDVEVSKRASEGLQQVPAGSRIAKLYQELRDDAQANINQALTEGELDE